jgi:hypothetical protein
MIEDGIALMMEAARTSETLVNFYHTTVIFVLTAVRTSNPTKYFKCLQVIRILIACSTLFQVVSFYFISINDVSLILFYIWNDIDFNTLK